MGAWRRTQMLWLVMLAVGLGYARNTPAGEALGPELTLGDAVRTALSRSPVPVHSLAVRALPRSGKPAELLDYEGISWKAIAEAVKAAQS